MDFQASTIQLSNQLNKVKGQQLIESLSSTLSDTKGMINHNINDVLQNITISNQSHLQKFINHQKTDSDWSLFQIIKILVYVLLIIKIIQYIFQKRKRSDIKQRVYRKFLFAHSEMIRQFNEEDRKLMNITLINTQKNAEIGKCKKSKKKTKTNKFVNFEETKNQYYQPKKTQSTTEQQTKDRNQILRNNFMSFLNSPQVQHKMTRQQPSDEQFEVIETIQTTQIQKQNEQPLNQLIQKDKKQ